MARKGVDLLLDLIRERGEVTRAEMIDVLAAHGLPHEGQAPVHLLSRAVGEGWVTSAGFRGSKPSYTLFEKRHGQLVPLQTEQALAEIARRYLAGYGPAGVKDFATWSGLKMSEAHLAWEQVSGEMIVLDGLVVGIWKLVPGKKKITIRAEIFPNQSSDMLSLIEEEALDAGRFLAREVDLTITRQQLSDYQNRNLSQV